MLNKRSTIAFINNHRMAVFLTGVIIISFTLVGISMALYYQSSAYRIDLSRPEFVQSRSKISNDKQKKEFPASGEVTDETFKDFLKQYDEQSKQITELKAFQVDVLDDKQLQLK